MDGSFVGLLEKKVEIENSVFLGRVDFLMLLS